MPRNLRDGHPIHPQDENGIPYGWKQIDGKPRVSSMDYGYDIAHRNIPGNDVIHIFGYNDSVADAWEDVTELAVDITPVPGVPATTLEMDSSSALDAGTVRSSGTATGGSATTLIDTGATFENDSVAADDFVTNDTDGTSGLVGTVDSQTQITLKDSLGGDSSFDVSDAYRVVGAASIGASVVEVHTLDGDFAEQSQFVVMNGETAVALTGTHSRVNNVHVMHAGAGKVASGDLTAQLVGGATIYGKVSAGTNMMMQCFYTIPAGKIGFITSWSAAISSTNPNTVGRLGLLLTADYFNGALVPDIFQIHDVVTGGDGLRRLLLPFRLPAKCDMKVAAQRTQGAADMIATGSIELWIEDA